MGQYHSPYMAMDNRWNMSIDPTGGCTVGVDCPEDFDWMGSGTVVLDEIVLGGNGEFSAGIPYETSGLDFRSLENMFSNVNLGSIRPAKYDWTDKWAESNNLLVSIPYDIVNGFYVTGQTLNPFDNQLQNFDGSGVTRGSSDHLDSGVEALTSLLPIGKVKYAAGPLKQWIRIGASYSQILKTKTALSIKYGASPKYLHKIPSKFFQKLNKKLRKFKLPWESNNTIDPGHYHIKF